MSPIDAPLAEAPGWLLELVAERGRPSGSGGHDLRSPVNDNENAGSQINYLGDGTFENVEMVYPGNVHGTELLLTAKAAYWNHQHYRDEPRALMMSRGTAIEAVVDLAFEALERSERGANWDRDQECETVTKMYDDAVNNWSAEWEAGSSSAKQSNARAQLIELTEGFEVWHTSNQEPYIKVPVESHHENLRIDGNSFSYWLSREHYGRNKTSPSRQALEEATHQITGHARFDGEEVPVHLRLGQHQGSIWIDLGDTDWSAVEVTSSGWRVITNAPIHFRRTAGMQPLPIPIAGGSLEDLMPFLNVGTEEQFMFLVGWLLAAQRPTGPFPILVINGEQGSGKSTLARVMRMLVDPSTVPIRSKPRSEHDLYIAANNGWVISLDNLSSVNDWLSDCLCRLATGGGFSTRQLYTDGEEVLIDVTRPIVINGIPDLLTRSDLADRALVLELPRLEDCLRQTEREFWASFEEAWPRIFGVLLDGISHALSNIDNVRLESPPRMADFAQWVVAAETGLGWSEGKFLSAYANNRNESIEVQLAGSEFYQCIELLLAMKKGAWKGTASQLLDDLNEQASTVDMPTGHDADLPTSPREISNRLRQITPLLRQRNIKMDFRREKDRNRTRIIQLVRIAEPSANETDPET